MNTAPAYDFDAEQDVRAHGLSRASAPAYEPTDEPHRSTRPDISVVPGGGAERSSQTFSPTVVLVARIAVAVFVVLVVLSFVRITLSASSVTVAMESQQYSSQIDEARSETSELEVSLASLSNPTRIKGEATTLGMNSAAETTVIDLSDDVVVTDEAGTLSLSGSVAALTAGQSLS